MLVSPKPIWGLHTDGLLGELTMGTNIMLKIIVIITIMQVVKFNLKRMNNKFECEALLTKLRFA